MLSQSLEKFDHFSTCIFSLELWILDANFDIPNNKGFCFRRWGIPSIYEIPVGNAAFQQYCIIYSFSQTEV